MLPPRATTHGVRVQPIESDFRVGDFVDVRPDSKSKRYASVAKVLSSSKLLLRFLDTDTTELVAASLVQLHDNTLKEGMLVGVFAADDVEMTQDDRVRDAIVVQARPDEDLVDVRCAQYTCVVCVCRGGGGEEEGLQNC